MTKFDTHFKVLVARNRVKIQKVYFILPSTGANKLSKGLGSERIKFIKLDALEIIICPIVDREKLFNEEL